MFEMASTAGVALVVIHAVGVAPLAPSSQVTTELAFVVVIVPPGVPPLPFSSSTTGDAASFAPVQRSTAIFSRALADPSVMVIVIGPGAVTTGAVQMSLMRLCWSVCSRWVKVNALAVEHSRGVLEGTVTAQSQGEGVGLAGVYRNRGAVRQRQDLVGVDRAGLVVDRGNRTSQPARGHLQGHAAGLHGKSNRGRRRELDDGLLVVSHAPRESWLVRALKSARSP